YEVVRDALEAGDSKIGPSLDDKQAIEAFCAGYLAGMRLQPQWLGDSMGVMLASPLRALAGEGTWPSESWRQDHRVRLFEHLVVLYQYWQSARENEGAVIVSAKPRVGRNGPCPCGSGKKYKKCCALWPQCASPNDRSPPIS
ncbi:MAG TPA: SEC-C metal-binding domain-containing protein, partial [Polyangiaceae bacterium]|nr:SEC-C metal-binding domain-containing protein [Polyangiaceae bacterium]